ncbi:MAG: hypothetical protein H7240_13535 [Glaciimonas sp.]|nr:hypothetical protein [Glaciimonas sp.]
MKLRCVVHFRPQVAKAAMLLPMPVRKLATLLASTMGSSADQSTLHQTARLRMNVPYTWANVALRPGALTALTERTYNTREEVDVGLLD